MSNRNANFVLRRWLALAALLLAGAGSGALAQTVYLESDYPDPSDYLERRTITGLIGPGISLENGKLVNTGTTTQPGRVVNDLYTQTPAGLGLGGYVTGVDSADPQYAAANAAVAEAGGESLAALFARGVYVASYSDGAGADDARMAVGSVSLNNQAKYNDNSTLTRQGGLDVPLAILGGSRGVALAVYGYNDTFGDPGGDIYSPSYVAVMTSKAVVDDDNFLIAAMANGTLAEEMYQGNDFHDTGAALQAAYVASGQVGTFADFLANHAARMQVSAGSEFGGVLGPSQIDSVGHFLNTIKGAAAIGHMMYLGSTPESSRARSGYDTENGWRLWADASGAWNRHEAQGGLIGYRLDETTIALGLDKFFFNNHLFAGVAASYARGRLKAIGVPVRVDVDTGHVAAYLGADWNRFFANAGVGYSVFRQRDVKDHNLEAETHRISGDAWYAFAEGGYRHEFNNWTLSGTVGAEYIRSNAGDYTLSRIDGLLLGSSPDMVESLRTPLQVVAEKDLGGLVANVHGGWTHEWADGDVSATSFIYSDSGVKNTFQIKGQDLIKNYYNIGAKLDFNVGPFATALGYDYLWGSHYNTHRVDLRAGVTF